ncbi:two-component regulator propeller domain-containing protein [Neolewinella lacunae]|uniref:Histidine kinase/HSP90-like ATPase domain-containing protein n=1 Tax=Neolewinella lacunae TaxID=1517758 RepID=A0A923PK64_9BACT|nr:sensor histidine kinase [Neolewinella lacunae]MBC6992703.1 hypothetical protein [Neolewinella lacunae]MDN3633583.1 two-component regulator propeller domain-containing protein [Neolewinella lacunae]
MRLFLSLLLYCTLPGTAEGQPRIFHYPEGHDLAYGTVQDLLVGSDGYLWVGGQTSLRRYDGSTTENFGHRREVPGSLSNDYVQVLYEDPYARLWIGHQRGLSWHNPSDESFRNFRPPISPGTDASAGLIVYRLLAQGRDSLWVASGGGLLLFDVGTETFRTDSLLLRRQRALGIGAIRDLARRTDGQLLLAGDFGLASLHPSSGGLQLLLKEQCYGVAQTANGDLVVARAGALERYRPHGSGLVLLGNVPLPASTGERLLPIRLLGTGGDVFYLGSTNGLFRVDWQDVLQPRLHHYFHDPGDPNSLAHNSVFSLAIAPADILLIGTRKGIDRISLRKSPIRIVQRQPGVVDLCHNLTKGSAYDPVHHLLLLGTEQGLSILDLRTGNVRCYTPETLPGLRKHYIFNVDPGPRPGTFWVGYRQGGGNLLVLDDPAAPHFEALDLSPYSLDGEALYQTAQDPTGTQWLATSNGLYAWQPSSGNTRAYLPDAADSSALSSASLFSVLYDRRGRLWVGTRNAGLCLRRMMDGKEGFQCFRYDETDPGSLPSDMILHLFEDRRGRIWVSNPEALAVYQEDGTFRSFGLADGLPYALCYGVFEDMQGRLWGSFGGNFTQFALSDDGRFSVQNVVTRHDGLAGQSNAQYGWTVLPDGQLALSQRDGLNLFHPDSLLREDHFPPVILTGFELFDHVIGTSISQDPSAPPVVLPDDINRLEEIRLPPGQNFISLSFSAPEFRPHHSTYFAYRMRGIQEEWTDTDGRNYLSFPHLPPGTYTLELRTGDAQERYSDQIRRLKIYLAAPWYQRWWALALFALAGGAVLGATFRMRERQRRRVEAARMAERENFRRRSARDFHDEAGNHLSRVSLLTALAARQVAASEGARPQVQGLLEDISSNVQVVREGMRDFIWALDPDNDNAYELALRLKRFGQDLFAHHPATFISSAISPELEAISLRPDQRRHLILLFKEAMHNTFKHAARATEAQLSFGGAAGQLRLEWQDNGPGFDPGLHSEGNGLRNMRERAEKIAARLEMLRLPAGGCRIRVELALKSDRPAAGRE